MAELTVLDTSVVVPWFFSSEALREKALEVMQDLRTHPASYVVPHLFFAEFLHATVRKSGRNLQFVSSALDLIVRLGLRTGGLTEQGLQRAAGWGCRGLSGYDAMFVALAEELGSRWLTADERAAALVGKPLAQTLKAWKRPAR